MASSVLGLNSDGHPNESVDSARPADQRRQDDELVQRLRAGEETAYEALIARFQQPVYNLAFRLLNDPGDAGDVAQEVFLKVFRNVGHFRRQSSLKTWIYRITVNEAHNQRRWFFRHRSREVGLDDEPDETRHPSARSIGHAGLRSDRLAELDLRVLLEGVAHHPVGLEDEHFALLPIDGLQHT